MQSISELLVTSKKNSFLSEFPRELNYIFLIISDYGENLKFEFKVEF